MRRYLCSKYLGRTTASVSISPALTGTVHLVVEMPSACVLLFNFMADSSSAGSGCDEALADRAIRCAVAQAHRHYGARPPQIIDLPMQLDLEIRPWVGDFMSEPYGGATFGIAVQAERLLNVYRGTGPERRHDTATFGIVERALRWESVEGPYLAVQTMRSHGVASALIARVMSCSAQRRKQSR